MLTAAVYRLLATLADKSIPLLASLLGKTGKFFAARRRWKEEWEKAPLRPGGIWIHAASAGEWEQARPVLEALQEKYPDLPVTVTFFSPSGYERFASRLPVPVLYLPLDTPANARYVLDKLQPQAVLMIKYEFWPNLLREIKKRQIPLFLVSGIFRENQALWKWKFLKTALQAFTRFFVQDETSARILRQQGFDNIDITGDTRFDTVAALPGVPVNFPVMETFRQGHRLLIAGSTWPADEDILLEWVEKYLPEDWKLVIVPHEPTPAHIRRLEQRIKIPYAKYSSFKSGDEKARILIADTMGLLKYIYRYGDLAYIGGGFGKGIHNTLEAAVYGVPVIFGPRYEKFKEARDLIERGAAFPVRNAEDIHRLLQDTLQGEKLTEAGRRAKQYVMENTGATHQILQRLEKYLRKNE